MWKLRDIIVAVVLSAVCGAIYMGWDWLYGVAATGLNPVLQAAFNGLWWLAAGLVPYIIRRPGAALLSEIASALFEFVFGSPYSLSAVLSGVLQGLGAEVGFAMFRWRRYHLGVMMLAGALAGLGYSVQAYFQYGANSYAPGVLAGFVIVTMLSGAVLGGALPKWIGDALHRTGSLQNFEIARQVRRQP
ncbi:ECF transporter S component [Alicyclobacillus shizuokensis]|uniref:ECF transporter S component n=1 Tax=Alicyclobacillus shizuokensis TaxID=392014 RepID=UPI00082C7A5B|nr:ECF transporter S component [Alicyclobacillus shizuokensis]